MVLDQAEDLSIDHAVPDEPIASRHLPDARSPAIMSWCPCEVVAMRQFGEAPRSTLREAALCWLFNDWWNAIGSDTR